MTWWWWLCYVCNCVQISFVSLPLSLNNGALLGPSSTQLPTVFSESWASGPRWCLYDFTMCRKVQRERKEDHSKHPPVSDGGMAFWKHRETALKFIDDLKSNFCPIQSRSSISFWTNRDELAGQCFKEHVCYSEDWQWHILVGAIYLSSKTFYHICWLRALWPFSLVRLVNRSHVFVFPNRRTYLGHSSWTVWCLMRHIVDIDWIRTNLAEEHQHSSSLFVILGWVQTKLCSTKMCML